MNRPSLSANQPVADFKPASLKGPVRRLELHLIYECVNECVFCNERDHMREFARHPATMPEVREMLRKKRDEGYEHVTFTGGEPTLFPKLWQAVELAKELGYRTFLISNGSALSISDFADRALPHIDELCLSIHGHDDATHTSLTQAPKSFERMCRTLELIGAHPKNHFLMVNHVVNRVNLPHLETFLEWVTSYPKVRHVLFSQLAPMGGAKDNYPEMAPKHSEIVDRLPALNNIAKPKGVAVMVYGIPICQFGEHWENANDLYFSPRLTIARKWNKDGTAGWFEEQGQRPTLSRFFPPVCTGCAVKGRCGGIYKQYWDQIEKPPLKHFNVEAAV
jgi:MoaA/NifB/PqqE/SkfB family radical SAM enzyme